MKTWSTACPDWADRILKKQSLIPFPPLFPAEAEAALDVFRGLRVADVAGIPTMGDVCRPWTIDFVAAIFGAYDPESGRRLITEFLQIVSKKNAKSTTAAGIMLTALIRNWRHSAEFLILAPTIEIANNSFHPARDMVRHDEELSELLHVQEHYRSITHRGTGATLKVVAADDETVGGKKATGVLIDEVWLFGKRPNAENMIREATGGRAARPEGFTILLSTQSDTPPAGIFRQKLQLYRDIRDGKIADPKKLPVLYEFPEAMIQSEAYKSPAFWYVTNPNLGASVDAEFLQEQWTEAERAGRESVAGFSAKHLNIEIGVRLRSDRWAGADYWDRGADAAVTLKTLIARSEVIVPGVDGGGLDDLFGLTVIGRDRETKHWLSWSHAWCHASVLERRKSIASLLRDFAAAGDLTIVDDRLDDMSAIVAIITEIHEAGLLATVAVDPACLGQLVEALADVEITQENELLTGIGQGFRLMNAIKTVERKLADGTFRHAVSALMDWCVGNVKIEALATAIRATKQHAGDAKIDPWAALMNAADIMSTNPTARGLSLYDTVSDERAAELGLAGEGPPAGRAAIDAARSDPALADRSHPDHEAARERFELALQTASDDEDY